ncbi:MAG TPA: beta-eliminating lyase-related protein [Candidatus Ozemobacteraceae bacterium]|nr:beta-eliminating lyase-related protein [Candidatus Ozemobacteraceae bacterium]
MHFGSDNQTGASEKVLQKVLEANRGVTAGYGDDLWSQRAVEALRQMFACDLDAHFVPTGTAANGLALGSLVQPFESILCHNQAHLLTSEGSAPEYLTGGARLIGISRGEAKLRPEHLDQHFRQMGHGHDHNTPPKALSVAQVAENGLVYSPAELKALCESAHRFGLRVHLDGARFANAVAALGCHPGDISWRAGVDVLSLGATKNGALAAEAVVFFQRGSGDDFQRRRKRAGHTVSKGRLFGAQFLGWLEENHWLELASHANQMACKLGQALQSIPDIRLVFPVMANELLLIMPRSMADRLAAAGARFFEWYVESLPAEIRLREDEAYIRLVTSFCTTAAEIEEFRQVAAGA